MNKFKLIFNFLFCSLFVLVASGCMQKTLILSNDFEIKNIDTITVLPVLDVRKDKSLAIDMDKNIKERVGKALSKKGYSVLYAENFAGEDSVVPEAIAEMEPSRLAQLGPVGSDYLFFFFLEVGYNTKPLLAVEFGIETSAVLVEKGSGQILWKDRANGSVSQFGLFNVIYYDFSGSLRHCVDDNLRSLPKKK